MTTNSRAHATPPGRPGASADSSPSEDRPARPGRVPWFVVLHGDQPAVIVDAFGLPILTARDETIARRVVNAVNAMEE